MKSAIVTGGTGFIGQWLIRELLSNRIKVHAIVRDFHKIPHDIMCSKNFSYTVGKIEEIGCTNLPNEDFDVFYHLAWDGVSSEKKNNYDIQLNNISIALKAMSVCNDLHIPLFVGAGTVAEYVLCDGLLDVQDKQTPIDMYGAAKTSAHYFLDVLSLQLKQDFIWAVIPSTYGEGRVDNNIITYTITSLLSKERPHYGNLKQMWDFLYVKDVANALRLIGEYGKASNTYGIGSGIYRPLRYYIETIHNIIDPGVEIGIGDYADNNAISSCVNIDALKRDTGFIPTTSFEQGISLTIDYWKKKMT